MFLLVTDVCRNRLLEPPRVKTFDEQGTPICRPKITLIHSDYTPKKYVPLF